MDSVIVEEKLESLRRCITRIELRRAASVESMCWQALTEFPRRRQLQCTRPLAFAKLRCTTMVKSAGKLSKRSVITG